MNKKIEDKISQCRNQLLQANEAMRYAIEDFMLDVKTHGFDAVCLVGIPYTEGEDALEGLTYKSDGYVYVHFASDGEKYGEDELFGLWELSANELYEISCCLLSGKYEKFNR